MASSSSTSNMLDELCFRIMFNQNLHEELVSKKKITPEVTFNLEEDKYPSIKEHIALRGWRRLASPRTKVTKWMIQQFYANAVQSDEEMGQGWIKFSKTSASPLSSGQPTQPIQLRRAELNHLARGWHEFIIHSIMPTGNKSEITVARAILIHSIIRGEDVRAEEIIADNIAMIAQGMQGKNNLAFPSTIFKLCKDAEVSMHEFSGGELIPQDKLITARLMETTRFGRNVQVQ
ncbi:hypothetical protein PIB30_095784 [Stylosanthes scabra]|uniref:Putative plant transposon protein domain-containing protein n=1 Tax=Stylosanthes scabra TaxID=79078 RepID=A0ABU6TVH0_9FABA|nr:hypothetical protein [Stylosanthes scabra]